jgi:hypothetical protein
MHDGIEITHSSRYAAVVKRTDTAKLVWVLVVALQVATAAAASNPNSL